MRCDRGVPVFTRLGCCYGCGCVTGRSACFFPLVGYCRRVCYFVVVALAVGALGLFWPAVICKHVPVQHVNV